MIIAGPIFILAMFFGALVIGLKSLLPGRTGTLRELESTADASRRVAYPFSVIEAEGSIWHWVSGRGASKQRDIASQSASPRKGRHTRSKRLRHIVDDLSCRRAL